MNPHIVAKGQHCNIKVSEPPSACASAHNDYHAAHSTIAWNTQLLLKTGLLFILTAIAEIVGCFLPYLWLRKGGPAWLSLPAAASLALFVWLLTLHPAASGRVYAAYGGVYVATALAWLRFVDGVELSTRDWAGAAVALCGMAIIVSGWGRSA
jgi:small multidrug resistance family-3 protein